MKKFFLFLFLLCATGLLAQQVSKDRFRSPFKIPAQSAMDNIIPGTPTTEVDPKVPPAGPRDVNFINPIEIGQAGNAWGFAYQRTTYLWAVNEINSITFIHRMLGVPGTGYLAYDLSTDGGQTWSVNNQVYDPTLPDAYNARYPQGVLFNPEGNSDPDNAYFSYFAPTLDGSNPSGANTWGGYTWGAKRLAEGSLPTQHNQTSVEMNQFLPSGFTLTQLGETWLIDAEETDAAGEYEYTGNLILGHGMWNMDNEEFDYTFTYLPQEIQADEGVNDVKVAFAPDGTTGYICMMSELPDLLPYTTYHPILFKTVDGGENWTGPIEVQLGGEDGLDAVKNFISDEMLAFHFDPDPVPPRDEIDYFMGYHIDMAVDAWGNPHLVGLVAIADAEAGTWWNYEGVFAMFHIWSDDQGETWDSFNMDYMVTFDGTWTGGGSEVNMYNRPQVSTTPDGAILFFSWLDTRIEGVEDNINPDIFFREYFPTTGSHGEEVVNVTDFSAAQWNAHWGCQSHYVFTEVTDNDMTYNCTIPFAYQHLTNLDPSLEVQFYYIPDFMRTYLITGLPEQNESPMVSLASNFPNPFTDVTHFNINLLRSSSVSVDIYNLTGQLVKRVDFGQLRNGPHQLDLNLEELINGVYFYTLRAGNAEYTGKMIAQ